MICNFEYHKRMDEVLIAFFKGDNTLNETLSKIKNILDVIITKEIEQYKKEQ